jgi:hypothetical protein
MARIKLTIRAIFFILQKQEQNPTNYLDKYTKWCHQNLLFQTLNPNLLKNAPNIYLQLYYYLLKILFLYHHLHNTNKQFLMYFLYKTHHKN